VIDRLALARDTGLGYCAAGLLEAARKPATLTDPRRRWMTGMIRECMWPLVAITAIDGSTLGMGITVCERTVWSLMNQAGR
jgi:putative transposase